MQNNDQDNSKFAEISSNRSDRQGTSDRPERSERFDRPDRSDRPERFDRPDRSDRPERFDRSDRPERSERFDRSDRPSALNKRPPLRETIMNMDRDILKMLARRCNIIDKMKAKQGYLDPREEKQLRASWEKNATQMTKDPRIVRQLFSLFQEIEFSAKQEFGAEKRVAFNLAPTKEAINMNMHAPLVSRRGRLYLSLAGASGSALLLRPGLLSDANIECIKMFNQCATSLAWDEDGTMRAREGGGLSLPDKVIFVGDDELNFYLLLGHYVGNVSRAKFTGETKLKLADFTSLRRFLPLLGARLSNAIPSTLGFPLRLECSGVLPDFIAIPDDIHADVALGLILAAPFWEKGMTFDLQKHPQADAIIEEALSVLEPSSAQVQRTDKQLKVYPSSITTPKEPNIGMEMSLAAYLLALPFINGGSVELNGLWPKCPLGDAVQGLLTQSGLDINVNEDCVVSMYKDGLPAPQAPIDATELDDRFIPLSLTFALCTALQGHQSYLPNLPQGVDIEIVHAFLSYFGFEVDAENKLVPISHHEDSDVSWSAPSVYWAMAFALCAFVKPHLKLSNPGVVTILYPQFWNLYNALPSPHIKKQILEQVDEKPVRRRIIAADQDGIGSGDSNN